MSTSRRPPAQVWVQVQPHHSGSPAVTSIRYSASALGDFKQAADVAVGSACGRGALRSEAIADLTAYFGWQADAPEFPLQS